MEMIVGIYISVKNVHFNTVLKKKYGIIFKKMWNNKIEHEHPRGILKSLTTSDT